MENTTYKFVIVEKEDKIGYVILNRPEKLNALSIPFFIEIADAAQALDADEEVRVIVFKGRGRSTSVGGDISPDVVKHWADSNLFEYKRFCATWWNTDLSIHNLSKPTILQVQGHFLAGATDLFLQCDLIVAAEDAQIGCPTVKGFETGITHMWTYLVGPQWAKYILLTGENIDGKTAERIGLVFKAVPLDQLDEEVNQLAQKIALIPAEGLVPNKALVNKALDLMGYAALQSIALETSAITHAAPHVRAFYSQVLQKGLKAALAWQKQAYS